MQQGRLPVFCNAAQRVNAKVRVFLCFGHGDAVGMNLFVLQCGTLRGLSARVPKNSGRDWMTGGMRAPAGKQRVYGFAPEPEPADAEFSKQLGAEHNIAILASLASPDLDKHPWTVDSLTFRWALSARRALVA